MKGLRLCRGSKGLQKRMPRLYYKAEWFDEISPSALAETEFESLLVSNADIIRPDSVIVPFKKTVYSPESSARADLAIISKDYRHWVVVEVELAKHDLHSHVIPQVRTLCEASYNQECADYIHGKCPNLDPKQLAQMALGDSPDVLVLVNKPDEKWREELRRYGAHMMVFEIFRSLSNRHIFVIDGQPPRPAQSVLSELSFELLVPRCLKVSSPAALPVLEHDEKLAVLVDEQLTYWDRFQTATEVYLSPVGNMPINPGKKYALMRRENGQYAIQELNKKG